MDGGREEVKYLWRLVSHCLSNVPVDTLVKEPLSLLDNILSEKMCKQNSDGRERTIIRPSRQETRKRIPSSRVRLGGVIAPSWCCSFLYRSWVEMIVRVRLIPDICHHGEGHRGYLIYVDL